MKSASLVILGLLLTHSALAVEMQMPKASLVYTGKDSKGQPVYGVEYVKVEMPEVPPGQKIVVIETSKFMKANEVYTLTFEKKGMTDTCNDVYYTGDLTKNIIQTKYDKVKYYILTVEDGLSSTYMACETDEVSEQSLQIETQSEDFSKRKYLQTSPIDKLVFYVPTDVEVKIQVMTPTRTYIDAVEVK